MAHETSAAGFGFLWPLVRFTSNGRFISISSRQSDETDAEPVTFLESSQGSITVEAFERAIDDFIGLVRDRLDCVDVDAPELTSLWDEITEERTDPELAFERRVEAMLGYDPDEVPQAVAAKFLQQQQPAGKEAICEIAAGFSKRRNFELFDKLIDAARQSGIEGSLDGIRSDLHGDVAADPEEQPWTRGWRLASAVRRHLAVGDGPVSDRKLAGCLGLTTLEFDPTGPQGSPVSLGVRETTDDSRVRFAFCKKRETGRRFEAARFLGDWLTAPETDSWLAAADTATYRQRMQRSFAAELLCPIESLRAWISHRDADPNDNETLEEAGKEFNVSPLLVRSHLAAHKDIAPF